MGIIIALVGVSFALFLAALAVTPNLIGVYLELRGAEASWYATECIRVARGLSASRTCQLPTNILAECARWCKAQIIFSNNAANRRLPEAGLKSVCRCVTVISRL
jgi:hypothetical protein